MAINITGAGSTGAHTFRRTNVNADENGIYYKATAGVAAENIPLAITDGTGFIYSAGIGSLTGVTNDSLVFVTLDGANFLRFSETAGGDPIDITGLVIGGISFNTPVVYENRLNIDASTPSNQAVKYYTAGTPLTGLTNGSTYFLRNVSVSDFAGTQSLYTFSSHTFTTCGLTGRVGPTQAQMRAAYSTTWDDTYLSQGDFQGYQDWTVPVSGIYQITARGAAGFDGDGAGGAGRGAVVRGRVNLTKGEVITIAVGQTGTTPTSGSTWGGSGGGTWIVRKQGNEPLFVAGGGSGASAASSGLDGVLTENGGFSQTGGPGGTDGNGGSAAGGRSAAGGGFLSRGADSQFERGGGSFRDGLEQVDNNRTGGDGGFGGAGSSDGNIAGQSGGAGGYSGGAGARTTTGSRSGGGGGSYITPTASNVATSNGTYNTLNLFNGVAITNLAAYNTGQGDVAVSLIESFTTGNSVHPTALDAANNTNAIEIESNGNSFHAVVPISLDFDSDQVHSSTAHNLTSGEAINYNFTGTPPLGLSNGSIYYVDLVSAYSFRLSTTPSPNFTTINLTVPSSLGSGDSLRKVIVNIDQDTITINNHGFLVDQPIQYSAGEGTPISPLQNNVTYYIAQVVDANRFRLKTALDSPGFINFTQVGAGTDHSFIFITVNALEDTLYIPNHGFVSGQAVRYDANGGTVIPGLIDDATYYIIKVDDSLIRLATNKALTNIANITGPGTGTQSLLITSLDFGTDTITLPQHGFLQGELVQYDSRGQTAIAGLTTATPYYVIFIDGDNIKLATTPENAEAAIAVDLQESPAGVGRHSLQSLSKTPDGIYDIRTTPSDTTFTALARGNVPEILKTFNPRSTIDLTRNTFFLPSHGFLTGTSVTYSQGAAATDVGGLTNNTDYFTVTVNRDYIRLATSAENAAAGITLDVDGYGTGIAHTFTTAQINGNVTGGGSVSVAAGSILVNGSGTSFSKVLKVGDRFRLFPPDVENTITFAAADVNTTTNRILKAHTYETGDVVKFSTGGGVAPSPLVNEYYYFVRDVSDTEITLHNSLSDAIANTGALDFTTQGTGTAFTLTSTTPVSPIIRRITAVGGDDQITVDRPYANGFTDIGYSFPTFIYVRPQGYSLHRPFDGGVEMSVGAGTSLGQIIRQTRKYFRYQSGKGIQTSAGINFKPSIDLESMERFSSTQVTCTTRRPHGLVSGLFVVVSQAEDSFGVSSQIYNGTFQVTVVNLTQFRITTAVTVPEGDEAKAYGFPQFFVREWQNGAIRSGMFDSQNGMFFEFDGQNFYCVRRSSTQQMAGTVAAQQGSELIFGSGTKFTAQLDVGDYVVLRGQSYRVTQIDSDTRMSVRPEYKGASGTEKEFDPTGVVNTTTDTINIIGHGFSDLLPVEYNSIDGEPIGGLINGRTYYVDLVDNNNFKLKASPDAVEDVNLSSLGTTNIHSFVPAKSGIIVTKTVDTRVAQPDWSIDPCDGTGVTGYNLDLSRIQMVYIDYSWYGAGKIRFGFKTSDGQVQYIHEFVHNNQLYESYFRSGNLPARYEVVTYNNPTYIPFLFHWGTSVMMDGRFDDDNAYLFTAGSQTLDVEGTTAKSFASSGINLATDLFTVQTHGFRTGDVVQFESIASNGLRGLNTQNPATQVIGNQTFANLTSAARYKVFVNSPNLIHLTPENATITLGATVSRSAGTVTVVTATNHNIPATGDNNVGVYGLYNSSGAVIPNIPEFYVGPVTVTNATTFTFPATGSFTVASTSTPGAAIAEVLNFTTQGNVQYTYFLYPDGSLNNTSGPNYQPLLSLRLSPSVSEGLTGKLGDRDIINRMQLRLQEIGISTTELVDVKLLINPRLNNLNFQGVDQPSLTQIVEHTAQDTVSGGIQIYNFKASGGDTGGEATTNADVSTLFELSNSILGGDSIYPDGPDILTIAVSRLTGNNTLTSAKLTWTEAQA
jgi:hypothetical protein